MRSVIKPRAFFDEFIARKSMPLEEVLTFFTKKSGKPDITWAGQFILGIHNGQALALEDATGKELPFSPEHLNEPDNYALVLKDIAALDSFAVGGYIALADLAFSVEDIPPENHCAVQFHALFRVIGERDGAVQLAKKPEHLPIFLPINFQLKNFQLSPAFFLRY